MTPRSPTPLSMVIVTATVSRSPPVGGPRLAGCWAVDSPFSQPVVSSRSLNRCAPSNWDPTIGTLGARPGFFANPHVTTADAAVPMAHLHSSNAPSGGAP